MPHSAVRHLLVVGLPPDDVLWPRLGSFLINIGTISLAAVAAPAPCFTTLPRETPRLAYFNAVE